MRGHEGTVPANPTPWPNFEPYWTLVFFQFLHQKNKQIRLVIIAELSVAPCNGQSAFDRCPLQQSTLIHTKLGAPIAGSHSYSCRGTNKVFHAPWISKCIGQLIGAFPQHALCIKGSIPVRTEPDVVVVQIAMKWPQVVGRGQKVARQNFALLNGVTQFRVAIRTELQLKQGAKPIGKRRKVTTDGTRALMNFDRQLDQLIVGFFVPAAARQITQRWSIKPLKKHGIVRLNVHVSATASLQTLQKREAAPFISHVLVLVDL